MAPRVIAEQLRGLLPACARAVVRGNFGARADSLRHAKLLVLVALAAVLPFFIRLPTTDSLALNLLGHVVVQVLVLAAYASYRLLRQNVRSERARTIAAAEAARLEGISIASRTVRHHVANKLGVTLGYSEMLADDPRLPAELQANANRILKSALAAAAIVQRLDDDLARASVDASVAGPTVLALDQPAPAQPSETEATGGPGIAGGGEAQARQELRLEANPCRGAAIAVAVLGIFALAATVATGTLPPAL